MAFIKAKTKIKIKQIELRKDILDNLCLILNQRFKPATKSIKSEIYKYIQKTVLDSITADELKDGGFLAANFGIPKGTANDTVTALANITASSAKVSINKFRRSGKDIVGGIKFGIILADYSDVLSYDGTNIITDKGFTYNWLDWLIKKGQSLEIREYNIRYIYNSNDPAAKFSRSGGAIMVKSKSGVWRVPIQFSGTEDDNWFTRCFSDGTDINADFGNFLQSVMNKYL